MSARERFTNWWRSPSGKERILGPRGRREVAALLGGFPSNHAGDTPLPALTEFYLSPTPTDADKPGTRRGK